MPLALNMSAPCPTAYRSAAKSRIILVLATILITNPVVTFLLSHSVFLACAITSVSVLALHLLWFRWHLKVLPAFLFNCLVLVFLLIHAEAILVFGFPAYVLPNLYTIESNYYFNRPLLDQIFATHEYTVRYRTNTQGLRISALHDQHLAVTTADWLVLGDSFAQGAQVEFEDMFSTQLNRRFPDKIVINAGISGLGLGQEYHYFLDRGYQYRPRLVILLLCSFNDFMHVSPSRPRLIDRLLSTSAFSRFMLADLVFTKPSDLPLGRWTEPFYPSDSENASYNIFFNESSVAKKRDLADFEQYIRLLKQAVESRAAALLVALIPTREQVSNRALEQVLQKFSLQPSSLNMRRPNELLRALSHQLNVPFLDLLPAFQVADRDVFFEQDEHLTSFGHTVVAETIGAYLETSGGASAVSLLSTDMAAARYPMLSQDGAWLSYQSARDGSMELFVDARQTGEKRRLTFNNVDDSHPMLSRDNRRVLFTRGAAEALQTEVISMNLDGSDQQVLTAEPHVFGAVATFSASNAKIAYAEWRYDQGARQFTNPQIVILNAATRAKDTITSSTRESWRPVFAPDEKRVAYISKQGGQFDLYLYDLTVGREERLTETKFDEWDPQFTPDGLRVIYAARVDDNWDLFLYDIAKRNIVRLTKTRGDEWDPTVSPDGASILFGGRFGVLEALFQMPMPM